MKLTNDQLKKIYYGAYCFSETSEGYLQAFQYTERQMRYFEEASDFWFERCMASTAKTILQDIETAAVIYFIFAVYTQFNRAFFASKGNG